MRFQSAAFFLALVLFSPDTARAQARIIGGGEAAAGAYPWMAALVEKGRAPVNGQICGGMLVAPQWVLTAAHCVDGENRNSLDIWVGLHDLRISSSAQKRNIVTIFRHPSFRADRHDNLFYDLALILLDRPVTGIPPVDLASEASHNDLGENVRILGWGATHPTLDIYPNVLQQADLETTDIAGAQADYQNSLGPYHLAAGVPDGSRDSCAGDSGGPMFRIIDGNEILVGIVSFGEGCATPGIEGIYTNVLYFRSWIDSLLAQTLLPPNLKVTYRNRTINYADRSPSRGEGTLFGRVPARGKGKKRFFRARNEGAGLLMVHGSRISNRAFKFIRKPPEIATARTIPAFRIRFDPRRKGRYTATVRISSNDPDTPLYWFRVRGTAR